MLGEKKDKERKKKEEKKGDSTKKFPQILIKYNSKEVREVLFR